MWPFWGEIRHILGLLSQRIQKLVTIHLVFPGADFVTKVRSQWSHFNGFFRILENSKRQNIPKPEKNNGFGTIVTSLWSQNQPLGKQGEMWPKGIFQLDHSSSLRHKTWNLGQGSRLSNVGNLVPIMVSAGWPLTCNHTFYVQVKWMEQWESKSRSGTTSM